MSAPASQDTSTVHDGTSVQCYHYLSLCFFTIPMHACPFYHNIHVGGVLGVNLTEVSTMLSQRDDFTRFNTSQLKNMVSIHISLVCLTLFCTFPAPIFKCMCLSIPWKCDSRCGMLDIYTAMHNIIVSNCFLY